MLILVSTFALSMATLFSTLSGKDLEITTICMKNKHPCVPETLDCSPNIYATSISLQTSIKQLLTMIDPDYSSKQGSFKTFPGIESGALIPKTSNILDGDGTPDLAKYNLIFNGRATGWRPRIQDTNQYFQVGSSIPFVYEGLKMSGRNEFTEWITSYKISYTLDGVTWTAYKNSEIFIGNSDSKEPVNHIFEPFVARAVKIIPQTWSSNMGGRFEFYISKAVYSNALPSNTLISAVASGCKVTASDANNYCGVANSGYDFQNPTNGCYVMCLPKQTLVNGL